MPSAFGVGVCAGDRNVVEGDPGTRLPVAAGECASSSGWLMAANLMRPWRKPDGRRAREDCAAYRGDRPGRAGHGSRQRVTRAGCPLRALHADQLPGAVEFQLRDFVANAERLDFYAGLSAWPTYGKGGACGGESEVCGSGCVGIKSYVGRGMRLPNSNPDPQIKTDT